MSESENISEGQKKLKNIKQKIESRKDGGVTEEEKEQTRQDLLHLKDEIQKANPDDAGEIYADIIEAWKELKNHLETEQTIKKSLIAEIDEVKTRFDTLVKRGIFDAQKRENIKTDLRHILDKAKTYKNYDLGEVYTRMTSLMREIDNQIIKPLPQTAEIRPQPVLSSDDEEEIKTSVGEYKRDLQRHEQNMDLLNRTFPGRLNDHIQFLVDLGVSKVDSYFIDIGPGVADHHDQEQNIRRNYPAITSVEMAKALKKNHTIALDLPESVDALMNARRKDSKIGAELLGRDDIQVLSGDGLISLKDQIEKKRDALGQSIKLPGSNDIIIVRACNSIDIYCDWSQVKPALKKMGEDFKSHRMILFFGKKILAKEAGKTWFTIIGDVSDRGFNHNEQTTKHVPRSVPAYRIRENHLNFGDTIQLIQKDGFRKGILDARVDTPSPLPENATSFLAELDGSDDEKIRKTGAQLGQMFGELTGKEKEFLMASKPHMHRISDSEISSFYNLYGNQEPQDEYHIVVNINEGEQKAYLVDPSGTPKIVFDISSGRGDRTPVGNFQLQKKSEDNRTIPFRKFGQAYHKQSPDGMIDWDGSAQMTTAILAMNMVPNIYFHGTNKEQNLGTKDSAGCIRMDNISIAFLSTFFENIGIKNVSIVNKKGYGNLAVR